MSAFPIKDRGEWDENDWMPVEFRLLPGRAPVPTTFIRRTDWEREVGASLAQAAPPVPRLRVEGSAVLLDGQPVPLGMTDEARDAVLCLLTHLLASAGDWRSRSQLDAMERRGPCKLHVKVRWDRFRKKLPPCLLSLTESDRRKGFRLRPAAWHR